MTLDKLTFLIDQKSDFSFVIRLTTYFEMDKFVYFFECRLSEFMVFSVLSKINLYVNLQIRNILNINYICLISFEDFLFCQSV